MADAPQVLEPTNLPSGICGVRMRGACFSTSGTLRRLRQRNKQLAGLLSPEDETQARIGSWHEGLPSSQANEPRTGSEKADSQPLIADSDTTQGCAMKMSFCSFPHGIEGTAAVPKPNFRATVGPQVGFWNVTCRIFSLPDECETVRLFYTAG
jgi:hypothetical protein